MPVVGDEALIRTLIARLDGKGISVLDVETVWIGPAHAPSTPADGDRAPTRLPQPADHGQRPRSGAPADNFSRRCQEADRFGMNVGMEFAAYAAMPTLQAVVRLVQAIRRSDAKVLIDALHFARSRGEPSQIVAIDPALLAYCQLADARGRRPADDEAL